MRPGGRSARDDPAHYSLFDMADSPDIRSDGYLDDLAGRGIDEVRAMRAACIEVETNLSYMRRLVQGRLDIAAAEQRHRAAGTDSTELADLVEELPEILSEYRHPGGPGRLPQSIDPGEPDPVLLARLDAVAGPASLADLPAMTDEALTGVVGGLDELERDVSGQRRELFDRIDTLQAELTRRYRSGEASVESLLPD